MGAALSPNGQRNPTIVRANGGHSRCVAHELGLMTSEDDKAVRPWRIADLRTTEEQLVGAEWDRFRDAAAGYQLERALVSIQRVVGVLRA